MLFFALFFFLISYFFYMMPTVKVQLAAMQDADYFYEKYVVFMKGERKTQLMWVMVAFIGATLLIQKMFPLAIYLILHGIALVVLTLVNRKRIKPNPIERDGRITRVGLAALGLFLLLFLLLAWLFKETFLWEMPFILSFLTFMTDTWILLGNWIASPGEKSREKREAAAAGQLRAALNQKRKAAGKNDALVIGVAGSFGKTGFIQVAKQLLSEKFQVVAPDPNLVGTVYNAAGAIRQLSETDADIAFVEIMARHPGEIKKFKQSIPLEATVLTSAADRSMETFLAKERMSATLMEIAEDMPEGGELPTLTINYDDDQLRKQKLNCSALRYGSFKGEAIPQHLDLWAKNLNCDLSGSAFTLNTRDGQTAEMKIPLLGRFTALYAVAAAGLCQRLGMTVEEIRRAMLKLTPMEGYPTLLPAGSWPERVKKATAKPWETEGELTKTKAIYRILDDPNEASLEGAKETLNVLSTYDGFKILMTQGLRGQGEQEDEFNRLLGRHAAKCVDAIVVIGKEKFSCIEDGAQRGGFAYSDLHLAADLRDAILRTERLAEEMGKKCCVAILGRV